MHKAAVKAFTITLISLLTACSAGTKENMLPQTGPTMEDVYRNHEKQMSAGGSNTDSVYAGIRERLAGDFDNDLAGYTRDASREIHQQFPRLPNPTLVMFVYPHLSTASRLPVPGYSTAFPMYERPEYALPGEL